MSEDTAASTAAASLSNHDAGVYRTNANFVYSDEYTAPLFKLLDARPGEKIVDLGESRTVPGCSKRHLDHIDPTLQGCGSGELTIKLANFLGKDGHVLAIDSNQDMVSPMSTPVQRGFVMISSTHAKLLKAKALAKVSSAKNITFLPPTDAQSYRATAEHAGQYDAVFSNAVLHWCKRDPGGVLEGIKELLKPGGRMAIEMGGHMNMIGGNSQSITVQSVHSC
jgi:trans-aconitate methyltransferase